MKTKTRHLAGLLMLVFSISPESHAQWVQTHGPFGGWVECIVLKDSNLFVGIQSHGVFRSTDSGMTWKPASLGLGGLFVGSLAVSGSNLIAGTVDSGVYVSTNNGATWNSTGAVA